MAATDDMIDELAGFVADKLGDQHRAEEGRWPYAIEDARQVSQNRVVVTAEGGRLFDIRVTAI